MLQLIVIAMGKCISFVLLYTYWLMCGNVFGVLISFTNTSPLHPQGFKVKP